MSYIYDVLANFNDVFYEFFDWYDNDSIVHIKKLPILKVNSDFLYNVKFNSVKVSNDFLDKIFRKAEFFKVSKSKYCYVCALCDGCEAVIVRFDSHGNIIGRSDLLIDEKNEVIDICDSAISGNYNLTGCFKNEYRFFNTRREKQINNFIVDELNGMSSDKLIYLYFDCFEEHEYDTSTIINRLIHEINNNFNFIYDKIYSFLKLTSINK